MRLRLPTGSRLQVALGNRLETASPANFFRHLLEPIAIVLPRLRVTNPQVIFAGLPARGPIDVLADDIGLPRAPVGFSHHAYQYPAYRHLLSASPPPPHPP